MSLWDAAGAAIAAAFADPEQLTYTRFGNEPVSIAATWSERDLIDGGRAIVYEIRFDAGLPAAPTKRDSFTHRGRRWALADHPRPIDAVQAWELTVTDQGAL